MKESKKWTADELLTLIATRHGVTRTTKMAAEWAVFFELQSGTGGRAASRMDAFAINCWPSKSFQRVGYEVKISRSDFLKELNEPSKRAWALSITNEFWFVCAPGICKPHEIPEGLGLLVPRGNGLTALVRPTFREPGDAISVSEVAAILRAACNYTVLSDLRWQYMGTDITDSVLADIISQQRSYAEQQEINSKAEEIAKQRIKVIENNCKLYASALKIAGVEPPPFLESFSLSEPTSWRADKWVKDNITPGPSGANIEKATRLLKSLGQDVSRALECIENLKPNPVERAA